MINKVMVLFFVVENCVSGVGSVRFSRKVIFPNYTRVILCFLFSRKSNPIGPRREGNKRRFLFHGRLVFTLLRSRGAY